jgi:hypothetical protein
MSQVREPAPSGLLLKLSVPAEGPLRIVATDIAASVAEYLQAGQPDADSVRAAVETAAAQALSGGSEPEIALEFRLVDRELLIEARCGSRSSEVRCQLPA